MPTRFTLSGSPLRGNVGTVKSAVQEDWSTTEHESTVSFIVSDTAAVYPHTEDGTYTNVATCAYPATPNSGPTKLV
jgi:hypothetical protein